MENKKDSPKKFSTISQKILNQDNNGFIRMTFLLIVICSFAICLTLYLCGFGDAQQAILQNNGFTSSFLYKVWFVVPLLCIAFFCLLFLIYNIKVFTIYIILLLFAVLVLFIWTFANVYFNLPNKSSKTTQIMGIITISITGLLAIFAMYTMKMPILTLVLMLPIFFFEAIFIYVGGVQAGEWQNF